MMIDFEYLFNKYNIKATGVLHCGASTCQERDVYEKLGVGEVIWVEAIPDVYEQAQLNLRGYENQIVLNACLADESDKIVKFNVSNNEAQSSSFLELGVHKTIHPEVHYTQQLEMVTIRLDDLLEDYDTGELNFGNFDLQGAELLAIQGMGDLIHQFDYMYLEINKKETYINCALVEDVDLYLSDFGFERVETGQWVADTWTDALYIRKHLL